MRNKLIVAIAVAGLAAGVGLVATRGEEALKAGFLRVTPVELSFDGAGTQTMKLVNKGPRAVSYEISADVDWLAAEPSAGLVARGATVSVTIRSEPAQLPPGDLRGTVTVATADGDAEVLATITVGTSPAATGSARLELPVSLELAATATSADLRIGNAGAEVLNWTARPSGRSLILDGDEGTIPGGGTAVVRVTVDRAGLDAGTATATIEVTSNGGNGTVPVTIAVDRIPLLHVDAATVEFPVARGGRKTLTLDVRNAGLAPLSYQASVNKEYVTLAAASGTVAPGGSAAVRVTFDYDAAGDGPREVDLRISSNGGDAEVLVTGARDTQGPYPDDREMSRVHRHCAAGECDIFRHVTSNITDRSGSRIVEVKVEYQVCAGAPKTDVSCDGFRFVPMRRRTGNEWFADVPLPACVPGNASYIPWRIWATDSLGNLARAPGSSLTEIRPHCNAAGEYR